MKSAYTVSFRVANMENGFSTEMQATVADGHTALVLAAALKTLTRQHGGQLFTYTATRMDHMQIREVIGPAELPLVVAQ